MFAAEPGEAGEWTGELTLHEFFPQLFQSDQKLLSVFLDQYALRYEPDIEYACGYTDQKGNLAACGCCARNILKCFAVHTSLRGQNRLGPLLSQLTANRFQNGYYQLFVYTKPGNASLFEANGFYRVAQTAQVLMLENQPHGIARFLHFAGSSQLPGSGAAVMNCNPLTLGHLSLIRYAAQRCNTLYLFVVEEERSVFPFDIRFDLVKRGAAHLPNVRVLPSGPYQISGSTFPAYFLKQQTDSAAVQAELDLTLFAKEIAPALGITTRFVGEEPTCGVTAAYNQMMQQVLPRHGIQVQQIPRLKTTGGEVISASTVRHRLAAESPGPWLGQYVPRVTSDYLCSGNAQPVLEALRSDEQNQQYKKGETACS